MMPIYTAQWAKGNRGYLGSSIKEARAGEIDFVASYAIKTGGPILELACGAGRVMFELAKRGFEVYGIDASWPMIEVGKEAFKEFLPEVQSRIHFIQGDMRSFSFRKKFPLIIIPFNSFWFNLDTEGAEKCVERITENIIPKGLFLIEYPHSWEMAKPTSRSIDSCWNDTETWWEKLAQKYGFTFKAESYSLSSGGILDHRMLIGTKI